MHHARDLASLSRSHGPEKTVGRRGGVAAGSGAYAANAETVRNLDDRPSLGAKDRCLRREPEAWDAHTDLQRERHEARRRGPRVGESRSTAIAVPLSDRLPSPQLRQ